VLDQIAELTLKIKHYDHLVKRLTEADYPETQSLIKVYGVGQLTAFTNVLTLGSKQRFQRSRDVGCYLGLRPRRSQSGGHDPHPGITKAGNIYLRSLLVECANHILGPRGKDSTLRQWGLHLASREESSRATELPLRSHVSWLFCCIVSGLRSNRTSRSTPKQPEVWIMFNCRNPASR
jgi:transposase